jgi:hypothetical protein
LLFATVAVTLALLALAAGTVAVVVTVHGVAVALEQLTTTGSVTDGPVVVAELPLALTVVVVASFGVVVVVAAGVVAVPAALELVVELGGVTVIGTFFENSLVTPGPLAGTVVAVEEMKR